VKYRAATRHDIAWFCHYVTYSPTPEFGGIVAHDEKRGVQAMDGFDFWTPLSVHAHIAVLNPHALRGLWREVQKYLTQHGRRLIIGMTPSHLPRALRLIKGLGFEEVYRIRQGWNEDSDIVITEYRIHGKHDQIAA